MFEPILLGKCVNTKMSLIIVGFTLNCCHSANLAGLFLFKINIFTRMEERPAFRDLHIRREVNRASARCVRRCQMIPDVQCCQMTW